MYVIFVFLALLFLYAAAIPVKFALEVQLGSGIKFGTGISIFAKRYAAKAARLRCLGEKKRRFRRRKKPDLNLNAAISAGMKPARYLLRHVRLESLELCGRLCLGDAARTAMVCGCLHSLEGMLLPMAESRVSLRPQADFSAGQSELHLRGMVSLSAGHIILAALIGAWNYMIRRISHGKASD